MRINETYRPRSLREVVGQPPVALLRHLAANPTPTCLLLEGPPGCGKTSSALALAADIGCTDEWSGLEIVPATELTMDRARELFLHDLRLRPLEGQGWHLLVIEELEQVHPQVCRFLKVHLERLPPRVIVVATSNGAGGIEEALLQRFRLYAFKADANFVQAAEARVTCIWQKLGGTGAPPADWKTWGWRGKPNAMSWSMRACLDQLYDYAVIMGLKGVLA